MSYNSLTRKQLAAAYGCNDHRTIIRLIKNRLDRLSDEQLLQLGEFTGHTLLLPEQVEIIVLLMGKPARPDIIYP